MKASRGKILLGHKHSVTVSRHGSRLILSYATLCIDFSTGMSGPLSLPVQRPRELKGGVNRIHDVTAAYVLPLITPSPSHYITK